MKILHKLTHRRFVEFDDILQEKVYSTTVLGFFRTEEECRKAIPEYITQEDIFYSPGDFRMEKVKVSTDLKESVDEFVSTVFELGHDRYDEINEQFTTLGYYSTRDLVNKALQQYVRDDTFQDHLDGFWAFEYIVEDTLR